MTRVLVCGGRDYALWEVVRFYLDEIHAKRVFTLIIHGDADGADTLAKRWARKHANVPDLPFPAMWDDLSQPDAIIRTRRDGTKYDARAGMRRNLKMLVEGKPDLVVAFPGGAGTANMVRLATAAKMQVVNIPRLT